VVLEVQKAPVSEVDPFCREFFEDPFPTYEELREAGPVVRLSRPALQQHITRISQPTGYCARLKTVARSRPLTPPAARSLPLPAGGERVGVRGNRVTNIHWRPR
jgi:hypothetical protein